MRDFYVRERRMVKWGTVLVALALVVAAGGCAKKVDPKVKRAQELLSIDEYDAAVKELKIYLKQHDAPDPAAKGLLLFALMRSEKSWKDMVGLMFLSPTLEIAARGTWPESMESETRETVSKALVKLRRELFDKGIDTKDAAELGDVVVAAARYIMKERQAAEEREPAAFVLASRGDKAALDYLVGRLKGSKTDTAEFALFLLGDKAVPPLQRIVSDQSHLARAKALEVLARVSVRQAAKSVFASFPRARAVTLEDLPEEVRSRTNKSLLETHFVGGLTREIVEHGLTLLDVTSKTTARRQLNDLFGRRGDTWEEGVLVLSGINAADNKLFTRVFWFDGKAYTPLKIKRGVVVGADVGGATPVLKAVAKEGGTIELTRPEVVTTEIERVGGPASTARGARVAIRGHRGTVTELDDAGLVHVKLDEAINGERELVLSPGALSGLRKEKVSRPGYRVLVGKVSGAVLTMRDDLARSTETLDEQVTAAAAKQ